MNIDQQEIDKFAKLAHEWWNVTGQFKTLHHVNPQRLAYIQQHSPLAGLRVLDVGCGGGILSEAMAQAGADVTGIDVNEPLIEVARTHAAQTHTTVDYQLSTIEAFADTHAGQFDVVTCLEMLEHVPDPAAIVAGCARVIKPGGQLYFSTINRTWQAYLFAIVGAEYVLKLLPKQTHDYRKLIRPAELNRWCEQAGLSVSHIQGLHYNPLTRQCSLTRDISINYLACCQAAANV
jgi:2-polyprenyl-6-hydroxyphenyl methylase/3-demethylubiquinone-9 3-methyltransferase